MTRAVNFLTGQPEQEIKLIRMPSSNRNFDFDKEQLQSLLSEVNLDLYSEESDSESEEDLPKKPTTRSRVYQVSKDEWNSLTNDLSSFKQGFE